MPFIKYPLAFSSALLYNIFIVDHKFKRISLPPGKEFKRQTFYR